VCTTCTEQLLRVHHGLNRSSINMIFFLLSTTFGLRHFNFFRQGMHTINRLHLQYACYDPCVYPMCFCTIEIAFFNCGCVLFSVWCFVCVAMTNRYEPLYDSFTLTNRHHLLMFNVVCYQSKRVLSHATRKVRFLQIVEG
jgi:hypothetical protein